MPGPIGGAVRDATAGSTSAPLVRLLPVSPTVNFSTASRLVPGRPRHPAGCGAFVGQRAEARDMNDHIESGGVVVRVQPEPSEGRATPGAAVLVLAPALHAQDLPLERRVRIEALAPPPAAVGARHQSDG